jgi:hypothetical protein
MKLPPHLTALTVCVALAPLGYAQITPPAPPPAASARSSSSRPLSSTRPRMTGYAAQETLAGTRLRTDLRDVGASLTVITPEFLQDLAANSLDKALLYTPSVDTVEGENSDGTRAAGQFLRFGTGQQYSIRGFVSNSGEQGLANDFFTSPRCPTTPTTSSASPSPAAPTPSSSAWAARRASPSPPPNAPSSPRGQKTQVQAQYDRWSSRRLAFDHNQPILPGRLAVRLNALHDEKREFRLYEGRQQDRLTFGVTARPFRHTTITANHEQLQPQPQRRSAGVELRCRRAAVAGPRHAPTVTFPPTASPGPPNGRPQASFDPRLALTQFTAQQPTWVVGLPLANPMVNMRFQSQVRPNTFGGVQNQSGYQRIDPWAITGLPRDANLQAGTWDDPSQRLHGRWTQLFVEQRLAEGLHLEVAGNLARDARSFSPDAFNLIKIDVDRYLPDGSLNPGYLVPYSETQGQYRDQLGRVREFRATLSYETDLGRFHRWLGRHIVSGLYQESRSDSDQDVMRFFNLATVGRTGAGWTADALGAPHILRTRAYFVNGQVPYPLPDQIQVTKALTTLNGHRTLVGANANDSAPDQPRPAEFPQLHQDALHRRRALPRLAGALVRQPARHRGRLPHRRHRELRRADGARVRRSRHPQLRHRSAPALLLAVARGAAQRDAERRHPGHLAHPRRRLPRPAVALPHLQPLEQLQPRRQRLVGEL